MTVNFPREPAHDLITRVVVTHEYQREPGNAAKVKLVQSATKDQMMGFELVCEAQTFEEAITQIRQAYRDVKEIIR